MSKPMALNEQQKHAVAIKNGPALVVAGAGTGKTRVIVERVLKLIASGVDPSKIVALTFTEKAAIEMQDRINEVRGGFNFDLIVMTYNAYGMEVLRRFGMDIGLSTHLKLIGEASQIVFLRENLAEFELDYYSPLSNPEGHIEKLADYFSRLKQNVIRPDKYQDFAHKLPAKTEPEKLEKLRHTELASAYAKYLELCRQAGVIDFDDQIYLSLDLFEKRPNVLEKVQNEVEYLLVDEFQDTNPMQSDFLDKLAGTNKNIMVVGDDDQSIYGWRGATLDNILKFKDRYPQAKEVVLTRNYRSTQTILDAAYKLIINNNPHRLESKHGFNKKLKSSLKGSLPQTKRFTILGDELTFIAEDVERRLKDGQDPGSIAILGRSNRLVSRLHDLFDAYGIHHAVSGIGHDLYRQPVVIDIINLLKAASEPTDNISLYHALTGVAFRIKPHKLSPYSSQARRRHEKFIELVADDEQLKEAVEAIRTWHELSATAPVSQVVYLIFQEKLKDWLSQQLKDGSDAEAEIETTIRDISEFFSSLKEFERIASRPTTISYLENVEALMAAGADVADDTAQIDGSSVNIMTIHKAKGLEWDTVYVADLTLGNFPDTRSRGGLELPLELVRSEPQTNERLLEERRLMYVAITRAARELILTHSERRRAGGNRTQPSPFIEEALGRVDEAAVALNNPKTYEILAPRVPRTPAGGLPASMIEDETLILSVSQIETYDSCPLNFYYKEVLSWPEEPSAPAAIGQLIHELIANVNRSYLDHRKFDIESVLTALKERWPIEGFVSPKKRQQDLDQALKAFKRFLEKLQSAKRHPDLIEQQFGIVIPEGDIRVFGRFDAVYSEGGVEIRDYKTGQVTSQEAADKKSKDSLQLSLYALAWQQLDNRIPEILTLDFVTSDFVGTSERSQKRINNTKEKIIQISQNIRAGKFPAGSYHEYCQHPDLDQ